MHDDTLEKIIALLEHDPHGAAGLTLYALVNTLEHPRGGHLFRLDKLRDLVPAQREIAYELMEMMAEGRVGTPAWQQARARMEELVRQG